MNIIDGIAYSTNRTPNIQVVSIRYLGGYKLWLMFDNNEEKVFDITPLLAFSVYAPLIDTEVFASASIDHGTVIWLDGEIDISPARMYAEGIAVCD